MNLSNIKNAMYRGYTYTRKDGNNFDCISISFNSLNTYIIAVFELDNGSIIITESINSKIISIKNITDNDVEIYYTNSKIFVKAKSVTVNYFSPSDITIESELLPSPLPDGYNSITSSKKTIYFDAAIKTGEISLDKLNVDILTAALSDDGSIPVNKITIGTWEVSKIDNETLCIDFIKESN